MDDTRRALRSALVDALAGEHRLRRQALREGQEAERWRQRAVFAEARGLGDLATSAGTRAERHTRMARLLQRQAEAMHVEVERLRGTVETGREVGRAPPPVPSLESRFAALELEGELERLSRERREGASAPGANATRE